MSIRARLQALLHERLELIRQRLLKGELEDDPRHARGRRSTSVREVVGGRFEAGAGGERVDPLPPPFLPPEGATENLLPGTVWDVTGALEQAVAEAEAAGKTGILVLVELSSCLYSERAVEAMRAGEALWRPTLGLMRIQPGDRLAKAYLRELRLGDARVVLTSMPLALLFDRSPGGLRFRALALDPLGPSRDHRRLRGLLEGIPQLAPGTEQETVRVWQGGRLLELGRLQGFYQPWEIRLKRGG